LAVLLEAFHFVLEGEGMGGRVVIDLGGGGIIIGQHTVIYIDKSEQWDKYS